MLRLRKSLFLFLVIITLEACGPRVPHAILNELIQEEDESNFVEDGLVVNTYYFNGSNATSKIEIVNKKDSRNTQYMRWTPNIFFPEEFKIVPINGNDN